MKQDFNFEGKTELTCEGKKTYPNSFCLSTVYKLTIFAALWYETPLPSLGLVYVWQIKFKCSHAVFPLFFTPEQVWLKCKSMKKAVFTYE